MIRKPIALQDPFLPSPLPLFLDKYRGLASQKMSCFYTTLYQLGQNNFDERNSGSQDVNELLSNLDMLVSPVQNLPEINQGRILFYCGNTGDSTDTYCSCQ